MKGRFDFEYDNLLIIIIGNYYRAAGHRMHFALN